MRNNWTREQEILALYAYCHVPFNKAHNSNPWIIRVANLIGRSPTAVKMKIGNFGSFDPQLKAKGIVGLRSISKLDEEIWNEYYGHWDKLAFDAEMLIASLERGEAGQPVMLPDGKEELTLTKRRINQSFFRAAVLSSYDNTCCISGITHPKLLEACHIVGWSEDASLRTDPMNGLCLNPLFHKAYDELLISITPDYDLKISDAFKESVSESSFSEYLTSKENTKIILPNRFVPRAEYLEQHYSKFIQAS